MKDKKFPNAKTFMGKNFLLGSDTAKALYHNYAASLPIIDYHCHISPKEIAEDKRYNNITEVWLGGDHYKWRAMRSCGIPEKYITGDASDYEKFEAYAAAMPNLIGNPLYHWSHLELRRYFGWEGILDETSCAEVWRLCADMLNSPDFSARGFIRRSNVEVICTTDDPCDSLEYHAALAADDSFKTKVYPAWRPDKGVNITRPEWAEYIAKLAEAGGTAITGFDSLKEAYIKRMDFFASLGCRVADHGIDGEVPFAPSERPSRPGEIFKKALAGEKITAEEEAVYKTELLAFFGGEYKRRGWVMQYHFGVLRNVSGIMFDRLGSDTGYDVIGGRPSITELAGLLGYLEKRGALPRTLLYSANPADNAGVGALIGAFQTDSEDGMPRLMQGSAWWFCDNLAGMREQMTSLANLSALGCFAGMLTDSRSFLSYTRHEYFRRILCGLLGEWAESGQYPASPEALARLVMNIGYNNAKKIFKF